MPLRIVLDVLRLNKGLSATRSDPERSVRISESRYEDYYMSNDGRFDIFVQEFGTGSQTTILKYKN